MIMTLEEISFCFNKNLKRSNGSNVEMPSICFLNLDDMINGNVICVYDFNYTHM